MDLGPAVLGSGSETRGTRGPRTSGPGGGLRVRGDNLSHPTALVRRLSHTH